MKKQASALLAGLPPSKFLAVATFLAGLLGAGHLAHAQVVSSTKNPLQIAILHWGTDSTTQLSVGSGPFGVAFDGAAIWVTNQGSNSVTELRASDGTTLGAFTVGSTPQAVAFDGANIWVVNSQSNTVSKL